MSQRYRGRLPQDVDFLQGIVDVCINTVALQILKSPLRDLQSPSLLSSAAIAAEADKVVNAGPIQDEAFFIREFKYGLPLGDPREDMRVLPSGEVTGQGDEPSSENINSGYSILDFTPKMKVLAWWWGYWWKATVQNVRHSAGTLDVRWQHGHKVTSGFLPQYVHPITD